MPKKARRKPQQPTFKTKARGKFMYEITVPQPVLLLNSKLAPKPEYTFSKLIVEVLCADPSTSDNLEHSKLWYEIMTEAQKPEHAPGSKWRMLDDRYEMLSNLLKNYNFHPDFKQNIYPFFIAVYGAAKVEAPKPEVTAEAAKTALWR